MIKDYDKQYRTIDLIPGIFIKDRARFSYAVLPLRFKDEQFGFVLCEMGISNAAVYDILINQMSFVVKLTTLIKEVRQYAVDLEQKIEERTKELKEAQLQLVEAAHQAGMTEIAIDVMHTIGNLLNSINISSEEINGIINNSKINALQKANQLLVLHRDNLAEFFNSDPKASLLSDYYIQISENLIFEYNKIKSETMQLIDKTTLIRKTISTLQDYASSGQHLLLEEKLDIRSIIDDAIKIQESNINKNNITIIKQYDWLEPIETHKTKLTHILVNLIKNAIESIENNVNPEPILTIKLYRNKSLDIIIEVIDNGEGIAPENVTRIFSYGFTTKENGHGFGLHTCANYITEMGGNISVKSKGLGEGATFTLTLQRKKEELK